jgi:tetratricopeptide (TPR) repeat protein
MKGSFLRLLSVVFLLAAASAINAQTIYDLKGRVYGPDTKPLANVLVVLENNARALIGQDTTNTDGLYEFAGIVAGTYYLSVKPDETRYQAIFQRVELINTSVHGSSSSLETVDFTLKLVTRSNSAPETIFVQAVPPKAEKEYLAAIKDLTKGNREVAANQLRKAIEIFPTYFFALQQLGALLVEQEKYEDAIDPLKKAIQVNARSAGAHLALGMALLNLDRLTDAITELRVARQLDSKSFRASLSLGIALMRSGDPDSAEQAFRDALALGGNEARSAHLYLASLYDKRKQYQKAITELETYLTENPRATNANNIKEAIKKLKAKM